MWPPSSPNGFCVCPGNEGRLTELRRPSCQGPELRLAVGRGLEQASPEGGWVRGSGEGARGAEGKETMVFEFFSCVFVSVFIFLFI